MGVGCTRAMLKAALNSLTSNPEYWIVQGDGAHKSLTLHPSWEHDLVSRQEVFECTGVIAALLLLISQEAPEPISPWLLLSVLDGRQALSIDPDFMKPLCDDALSTLRPLLRPQRRLANRHTPSSFERSSRSI